MPLIDTSVLETDLLDGGMPEPQAAVLVFGKLFFT